MCIEPFGATFILPLAFGGVADFAFILDFPFALTLVLWSIMGALFAKFVS